jgi:alginate O-acetyltransferase complex protein AlgI
MSFDSVVFAYFFIPLLVLYYAVPGRFRWWVLIFSSIFFYSCIDLYTIWVPVIITLITYLVTIRIENDKNSKIKKILFFLSISIIVATLVFYKYTWFLVNSITGATGSFFVTLIAPLGISYITFQAIGYLIDVYNGKLAAEKNIGNFAVYILFFPKLVAGPVESARHFLPQMRKVIVFNYDSITSGMRQFAWGLFKKLAIANRLGLFVDAVYDNLYQYQGPDLLIAMFLFAIQLYADFSGYTDMALGIAKIFGYELSPNFDNPFYARSMAEFWRKWHITLSSWFNTYFYTPLSIRMRDWGKSGIVLSGILSFLVLGLWHGPNWTFVVFGCIHGLAIAIEFLTARERKKLRKNIATDLTDFLGILYTFSFFSFSCIFFRANLVNDAMYFITHLFSGIRQWFVISNLPVFLQGHGLATSDYIFLLIAIPCMLLVERKDMLSGIRKLSPISRWAVYYLFLIVLMVYGVASQSGFIYKQF